MIVNITWLVERGNVQVLCSTPEKVNTVVHALLQDDSDLNFGDIKLYKYSLDSLSDINSPKELYVPIEYDSYPNDTPESIKITRLQLL